jgi:hypothetical protein
MERCLKMQFIRVETGCESEEEGRGERGVSGFSRSFREIIKEEDGAWSRCACSGAGVTPRSPTAIFHSFRLRDGYLASIFGGGLRIS